METSPDAEFEPSNEPLRVHIVFSPSDEWEGLKVMADRLKSKLHELGFKQGEVILVGAKGNSQEITKNLQKKTVQRGFEVKDLDGEEQVEILLNRIGGKKGGSLLLFDLTKLDLDERNTALKGRRIYHAQGASIQDALVAIIDIHYADAHETMPTTEELKEAQIRQIVWKMTGDLHYVFSSGNDHNWHDFIQSMKKKYPNFTSQKFFSYVLEHALGKILPQNPHLKNPEHLLDYLQSFDGKKEIAGHIEEILKDCPIELSAKILKDAGEKE